MILRKGAISQFQLSRARIGAAVLAITAAVALTASATARAAGTKCPNTFQVLHDDHVGKLSLPAGHYTIKVSDESALSCTQAAKNFASFLQDFDGVLPDGWKVKAKQSEFRQSGTVWFKVRPASSPGGSGGGSHPGKQEAACPTFTVEHNDMIGELSLPKGKYLITILKGSSLSCAKAAKKFAAFLEDTDGVLPGRWKLDVDTATFTKGKNGFRVKPS